MNRSYVLIPVIGVGDDRARVSKQLLEFDWICGLREKAVEARLAGIVSNVLVGISRNGDYKRLISAQSSDIRRHFIAAASRKTNVAKNDVVYADLDHLEGLSAAISDADIVAAIPQDNGKAFGRIAIVFDDQQRQRPH